MDTTNEVACPVGASSSSLGLSLYDAAQLLEHTGASLLTGSNLTTWAHRTHAHTLRLTGAACDSRCVTPGNLFFCKGASFTPAYLTRALEAGAVAYVCTPDHADELAQCAPHTPALVTTDMRRAMALLSAEAFGHPDRALPILGITGTKGKSTSSYMLAYIINAAHHDENLPEGVCGIIGSIETYDGIEHSESTNTTPEAPDLWRHLAHAHDAHLDALVMEVSSQALKYERTAGVELDTACFLNIGTDHISPAEHPSFEDYFASKLRIFAQCRHAVVNLGTDHVKRVFEAATHAREDNTAASDAPVLTTVSAAGPGPVACGARGAVTPDIWATDIRSAGDHLTFMVHSSYGAPDKPKEFLVTINFPGTFNVENALVAIACAQRLHIASDAIVSGLASCRVPGRMELIGSTQDQVVCIVDYAHNALSYQKFFTSLSHEFPGRTLIALIGAPGGKAYERRRDLPREAARWASHIVITEEDPGLDSNEDICREMDAAIPTDAHLADGSPVAHEYVLNRQEAIARCLDLALQSDTPALICLLGKGDETLIHRGTEFQPMEPDAQAYRRAAAARGLTL